MNINDKVVFIGPSHKVPGFKYNSKEWIYEGGEPVKGKVYVIKDITTWTYSDLGKIFALYIVGMPAYNTVVCKNIPWPADWFRKLEDIKNENKKNVSTNVRL